MNTLQWDNLPDPLYMQRDPFAFTRVYATTLHGLFVCHDVWAMEITWEKIADIVFMENGSPS